MKQRVKTLFADGLFGFTPFGDAPEAAAAARW
jgi:hypothetical protein